MNHKVTKTEKKNLKFHVFKQYCGSGSLDPGSGFNQVSGSGSVFGIRIKEGKNEPQK
jgi:hypothetical protein